MAGTETRRLTRTTTFRLSDDEAEALRAAAEARGLGPSAFVRVLVLQGIGHKPSRTRARRTEFAKSLQAVLGELGRIGSNVNQIAKVANATRDPAAIIAAHSLSGQVEDLARRVLSLREDS